MNDLEEKNELDTRYEVLKIALQEHSKRIHLQKEIEMKSLRYEYEKKQAAAKTE